jgi:tRNA dimethylallyltransferase
MLNSLQSKPILAILGPTASGKSALAIEIAKQYDGEIISVDSRQIYRGMDIGTGKVERDVSCRPDPPTGGEGPRDNKVPAKHRGILRFAQNDNSIEIHYLSEGIPHHLVDIVDPNEDYNVVQFIHDATAAIKDIQSRKASLRDESRGNPRKSRLVGTRGRLPILCGGTGFWAQALLTEQQFPGVPPNPELRAELSHLSAEALFAQLQTLDPERAATIDRHNHVRLIRAIEIIRGSVIASEAKQSPSKQQVPVKEIAAVAPLPRNDIMIIVLNPPIEVLRDKIKKRLDERFDQGMIEEVQHLHDEGVSWERLEAFGLEYRWIARFLQHTPQNFVAEQVLDEKIMREKLYFDSIHYAKRQLTWLRRWSRQDADIQWFETSEEALKFTSKKILKN